MPLPQPHGAWLCKSHGCMDAAAKKLRLMGFQIHKKFGFFSLALHQTPMGHPLTDRKIQTAQTSNATIDSSHGLSASDLVPGCTFFRQREASWPQVIRCHLESTSRSTTARTKRRTRRTTRTKGQESKNCNFESQSYFVWIFKDTWSANRLMPEMHLDPKSWNRFLSCHSWESGKIL